MYKKLDIKWYSTIDSTNMQAAREMGTAEEGTVWIADYQTSGRGQRGNVWESSKGVNLTFTMLLKPHFLPAQNQFLISEIIALGVVNYLKDKGLNPKIKWPNDIYSGDRKICGILIEHSVAGANLSASIIGVGININQTLFNSDAPNPTSLILEMNSLLPGEYDNLDEYDRKAELQELLIKITELYMQLEEGYADDIEQAYLAAMYRRDGEYYKFKELSGRIIEAKIIGPDSYGCLVLEERSGNMNHYAFQEIRYIL